jgi:hypothetical protein
LSVRGSICDMAGMLRDGCERGESPAFDAHLTGYVSRTQAFHRSSSSKRFSS